jgi:hypothetical protein
MRILLSLVAIATISLSSFGQAPEGFKYQAVVRDSGNLILNNQAVGMRLTVQQGSIGGTAVYTETFTSTTNGYGLVNLEIGTGTSTDDFSTIDWANGPYFMETAVDFLGGMTWVVMGTSQLMSVPYALYAKTSGNGEGPQGPQGDQGPTGPQGVQGATGLQGLTGPQGPQGSTGPQGLTGAQGPTGQNGNGIVSTTDNDDGTFTITYTDGSIFTTSNLTGPQGAQGIQGIQGAQGNTGATGQQGIQGNTGAQGPAGDDGASGLDPIDFSNISCALKADLDQSTQPQYGEAIIVKAKDDLMNGQPVFWSYDLTGVTGAYAESLPSQNQAMGICLEDIAAGTSGKILISGFATARYQNTYALGYETVILNSITNGSIRSLTNATTFLDSGGSGGDYTGNENYSITFDAGVGYDTKITVNDFQFEHSTFSMYDRLGIQGSNDGITFTNLNVQWLQSSAITTPPYGNSFAGGSSGAASYGWIVPKDASIAILIGGVPGNTFPADIVTAYRYIRFYFNSDGSINDIGWDITLAPNTPYNTVLTIAEGTSLYLENSYPAQRLTSDNTTQVVFGFNACSNTDNDSVLIRVAPPRD